MHMGPEAQRQNSTLVLLLITWVTFPVSGSFIRPIGVNLSFTNSGKRCKDPGESCVIVPKCTTLKVVITFNRLIS